MRLNQNNNPLISIVIATRITPERNRLNELERAIDSSIAQDYQPVEIIVLDDCSDINLNFLGEKSELIKIYRSKNNIGAAKIRNKGFFISKGKYVISLDDDAYFSDNNIVSSVVTQFEKLANVAIICMPIIKDKSHNLSLSENKTKRDGVFFKQVSSFCAAGAALRRDAILTMGGYRGFFIIQGEEEDLSVRLMDKGWKIISANFPPIIHEESPKRNWNVQHIYGPRNAILFIILNVPFPYLIIRLLFNTLGLLWHGLARKRLRLKLTGIIKGYSDSPTFWQQRQPVAPRTWRQYRRLLKQPEDYVAEW
jgi:GT2 family glycosyltransferase